MAGIYIHVPFCKQACNYCNFYFSTSAHFKEPYLKALDLEIERQSRFLNQEEIDSIYFGGGTPSVLSTRSIEHILNRLSQYFKIGPNPEITLEANPDDLDVSRLQELKSIGINRLSIGTQSFAEIDLKFMRRAHNAEEAIQSIRKARELGFDNLSIDLIYGAPTQSIKSWKENLQRTLDLGVNHLSCYALTVEEGTPLYQQIKKGQVNKVDEDLASVHFREMQEWASKNNWQHYEISNLCAEENYAIHNTSYWQGKPYLGLGPSAHSYSGTGRQWNVSNLKKYIDGINENSYIFEKEELREKDQFNEYVMTSLRTKWGIDKKILQSRFPNFYPNFEEQLLQLNSSSIVDSPFSVSLSKEGMFFADGIAASLFVE